MTRKVRWGVISTAKIGWEKVIPAMQRSEHCSIAAIASRNIASAQSWAGKLGIAKAYGSYEALLADPDIDAIYNPLPNDLHVEWTLKAAQAGKHVLCEKPFAMNAAELEQLRPLAGKVHIMEAFMVRHHPQWLRARDIVHSGELGDLRAVQVLFSYNNQNADNIRNKPENGGGALYDIGCYAIVAGRFLFGAEPLRVLALVDRDPRFGTDRLATGIADFGGGRRLDFTVSTQAVPFQRVQALGTRKRLEIEIPFNAVPGESMRLFIDDGQAIGGRAVRVETLPPCDQYTLQGDAFSRAVLGEAPLPYGLDDAVCNMRIIDALFASEKAGGWVAVATA
jgi:predicted dehydrogenase